MWTRGRACRAVSQWSVSMCSYHLLTGEVLVPNTGEFLGRPMTHGSCPYTLLRPPTAGDGRLGWRDLWSNPTHLVLHLGTCSRNFLAVPGKSSSVLLIWKASVPPKLLACQGKLPEELQAGAVPVPHPSPWLQPLAHVSLHRAQRSSWLGRGLAKPHAVSPFQPPVFLQDL